MQVNRIRTEQKIVQSGDIDKVVGHSNYFFAKIVQIDFDYIWIFTIFGKLKNTIMKLKKLRIENFRGYKDVTINFSDFNCIVGKNDVGKSTIFKALEKFFDYTYTSDIDEYDYNGVIKHQEYDSKKYPVCITVSIENPTYERLIPFMDNGTITIRKKYEKSRTSHKYKYEYSFGVKATIFGDDSNSILGTDGKLRQETIIPNSDFKIRKDKNDKSNAKIDLENGIYYIPLSEIAFKDGGNSERPFDTPSLFSTLPTFKFLKTETSLTDIQDLYVKKVLADKFADLSNGINQLQFSGENRFHFTNDSISINNNIQTSISENETEKSVPLDNRGEGFQLKIRNHIFIELAKREVQGAIIFAFEEPESHLHPDDQVKVYEDLKSKLSGYQVLITTHSPYIVKELTAEDNTKVIIVTKDKDTHETVIPNETEVRCIRNYVSMNEINYIAFEDASIEYHIELFGFIHNKMMEKYENDVDNFKSDWDTNYKPQNNGLEVGSISAVDLWLNHHGVNNNNYWYNIKKNGVIVDEPNRTLPHCVRNWIDHPLTERENTPDNTRYNAAYRNNIVYSEKTKESIDILRNFILNNKDFFYD